MPEQGNNADLAMPSNIFEVAGNSPEPGGLGERVLALFQQLHAPVFRFLIRKTRSAENAEDLTQETFLRLLRHLQQQRPLDNPKAWLLTVANNLVTDGHRSERNVKDIDQIMWEQIEQSRAGTDAGPEHLALERERLDRLHIAVLNLTPLQRQCLHLRAEGLRYREVAELLNISTSTVVDAVRRATVRLGRHVNPGVRS
jgi:RNA polymerase sigma-70 factor (ECF subfamily)